MTKNFEKTTKNLPAKERKGEDVIKQFKTALINPLDFDLPHYSISNFLDTDAGEKQIRCVSMQNYPDKSLQPIDCFCWTLCEAERNQETTERELRAIFGMYRYYDVTFMAGISK